MRVCPLLHPQNRGGPLPRAGLRPVVAPEIEFYLTAAVTDPTLPLSAPVGRGGRAEVGQSAFSMNMLNELALFWDEFHKPRWIRWACARTPGFTRWV